jgi:hypothetical protein
LSWLEKVEFSIPDLSLVPMSAASVVQRLEKTLSLVKTQYAPLVAFLVFCQAALESVTNKKNKKPPRACHKEYIVPLTQVFATMNDSLRMDVKELTKAERELEVVSNHAKKGENWTEMKQLFIGGMAGGHSSGLYAWVSDLGHARSICCDLECILQASCKQLDPSLDTTRKLAVILRSMATSTLGHLMKHVPNHYHLHSSTAAASSHNKHPPPPYCHRLESALRGMSTFDPTDDDIVCVGNPNNKTSHAAAVTAPAEGASVSSSNNSNHQEIISIDDSDDDEAIKKKINNNNNNAKKKSEPEVICIYDDSDGDGDGDEPRWI